MRTLTLTLVVMLGVCASYVRADERAEDKKKDEAPAATAPAASGETIDAVDIEKIKAAVGKTVTVKGACSGVFVARSGRILINFVGANRDFVGMITKENADAVNAGFSGDVAKALQGNNVSLTGEVKLYRESPQIEITKPDQIKVEVVKGESPPDEPTEEKPAEKKPE